MNDLDARVAALKPCPFCGGEAAFESMEDPDDENFGGEFIVCKNIACHACSMMIFPTMADAKPFLIEKWNNRTELQKPALQEPVTDAEVTRAIGVYLQNRRVPYIRGVSPYTADIRAVLESFLQGRAKPAQEEIPEELRGRIAYELIKRLTVDMPTARNAIDAATHASKGEKT